MQPQAIRMKSVIMNKPPLEIKFDSGSAVVGVPDELQPTLNHWSTINTRMINIYAVGKPVLWL